MRIYLPNNILTDDLPDYNAISPQGQVSVPVAPIKNAKLVWLNTDWFVKRGAVFPQNRSQIETWLLNNFAVEISVSGKYLGHCADRYGGALHGGSGRCINIGRFNAKGNGRTPLVPNSASSEYSHGHLDMIQALKQTIMSVVCANIFPHSAIPVLAIIDTKKTYKCRQNAPPEPCAIVVRPNFIRAAHLERSIFFGTAGFKTSDQYQDAMRVKEFTHYALSQNTMYPKPHMRIIANWFQAVVNQIGFGRSRRLWADHVMSSNICLDGAWCDHECFQTLPNFGRCVNQVNNHFGLEANSVLQTLRSLEFYLSREAGRETKIFRNVTAGIIEQAFMKSFVQYFLSYVGLSMEAEQHPHIPSLIQKLYALDFGIVYDESFLSNPSFFYSSSHKTARQKIISALKDSILHEHKVSNRMISDTERSIENAFSENPEYSAYRLRSECETLLKKDKTNASIHTQAVQKYCDMKIQNLIKILN